MTQQKISTYKNFVFALISLALMSSVVYTCNIKHKFAASDTVKDNLMARLEVERMLALDSVDVLNEQLQIEREALPKRLSEYSKLPTKERIKWITKIDTLVVITDTSATLSIAGVDSVNKLTIHYHSCMVQSAIKDTVITHLTNVVQADSSIISAQQKHMADYKQKEASRNKQSYWRGFKHGSGVATGLFAVIKALF